MMSASPDPYRVDYLRPPGEPSLVPPGSPQWRIFKNPIALGIGGVAAVLLEFADPRIRSGVWDHSTYKADPIGRSRRTGTAALAGVFGPASTARRIIGGVNRMHAKVSGETPGGIGYRALDPELLDWVAATAGYGFLEAYHRFVAPLSAQDRSAYYLDHEPIASLYGVQRPLRSDADFFEMLDALLPGFEAHPIVEEFLAIIMSGQAAPSVPKPLHRALGRAAVSLLPAEVRSRLQLGRQYDLTSLDRAMLRVAGKVADTVPVRGSAPWDAALRLGLPGSFAWQSPRRQRALLSGRNERSEMKAAT